MNLTFLNAMRFLKVCTLLPFIVSVVVLQSTANEVQVISSKIDSVVVYPDGAKITRIASVNLVPGENVIRFDFIPNQTDSSTFKVNMIEGDHAWVRDFALKANQVKLDDYPALLELTDELVVLNQKKLMLDRKIDMQEQRVKYAQKITDSFTEGYGQKEGDIPSPGMIEQTWTFYEESLRAAEEIQDSIKTELIPVEEAIEVLQYKILKVSESAEQLRNSVEVFIESVEAKTVEVELDYLVRSCGWKPTYEVRAYPLKEALTIRYQAEIFQQSGENWENVELTLSVTRANDWGNVEELYPIRLNKIEPMPVFERSAKMMDEAAGMNYTLSAAAPATPVFSSSFSSFSVQLPEKYSVESGLHQKKALIAELSLDQAEFWTEIVPAREKKGYLIASIENGFQLPMLLGSAIVFVDDQLMGKSFFEEYAVGSTFEISLGVNKNVQVDRENGKLNESDRGVFGKKTKLVRQYFSTIENVGKHVLKLKVKDQFPISENEKIVVNGISPASNSATFDDNTGIFTWDTELKPKSTETFETKFEVVFPEDWDIPTHF